MSPGYSLQDHFARCTQALRQSHAVLRQASPQISRQVANQYDRLRLWDHDVGVTDGSLDHRLKVNSGLLGCVTEMLKDLEEHLAPPESEEQLLSALEEITDIVESLISLEPTLRSPAPLDTITFVPPQAPVAQKLEGTSGTPTLLTIAEKIRFTSGRSDVDIVVFRERSLGQDTAQDGLDVFLQKLPTTLEENGIYGRVLVSSYEHRLTADSSIQSLINRLVKALSRARYIDPERPLQFVGSHRGVSIAQAVASTLIAEGLVVDTDRPFCGCTFFNTPYILLPETHKLFMAAPGDTPLAPANDADVIAIDAEFRRNAERFHIDVLYPQPEASDNMAMGDDEELLSIIHHIARTTETVINTEKFGQNPLESGHSQAIWKEDAFAILNGYDTAILVNDCGRSWQQSQNSIINIVRDCVDTVLSYRDDLDIQLSSSKHASFSVEESSQASRMLAISKPSNVAWRLSTQISRYLTHYAASPSSMLPDGALRPCNLIVLTASAPEDDTDASFQAISSFLGQLRSKKSLELAIFVQIVLLGEDSNAQEYFTRFDNDSKGAPGQFAPTFYFPRKYESHAEICKRILLGAISPRFATISLSALDAQTARLIGTGIVVENTDNSSEGGSIWSSTGRRRTGSISSAATTDYGSEIDPFLFSSGGSDLDHTNQLSFHPHSLQQSDVQSSDKHLLYNPSSQFAETSELFSSGDSQGLDSFSNIPFHHDTNTRAENRGVDGLYPSVFTGLPLRTTSSRPFSSSGPTVTVSGEASSSTDFPMTNLSDWDSMAFRQHKRAPSDARSDVSSVHTSPYLGKTKYEDQSNYSPLLIVQRGPSMNDEVMDFGSFSIGDDHSFSQFQQAFPDHVRIDLGRTDLMSPPEIHIQPAPPSRQESFDIARDSRPLNRPRSKSDSSHKSGDYVPSRASRDVLSPAAAGVGSRSQSSLGKNRRSSSAVGSRSPSPCGKSRRSSTSSVPIRDYILDLADPSRPAGGTSDGTSPSNRTQKHPATFQCTLCPKKFTRAYNLRSHLRSHTDERPFVCSVCGKAFARQHDRKRHEGLHSDEKKFVCRGSLKDGSNWGCGRRFARADALGRHFRSEAGRICIKPLLEEEAIERIKAANREAGLPPIGMSQISGQQSQPMMQQSQGIEPYSGAPQGAFGSNMQMYSYGLPAALLQQYPTLGDIWDNLPANMLDDFKNDRLTSFDASSGGEYEDDEDYNHATSR